MLNRDRYRRSCSLLSDESRNAQPRVGNEERGGKHSKRQGSPKNERLNEIVNHGLPVSSGIDDPSQSTDLLGVLSWALARQCLLRDRAFSLLVERNLLDSGSESSQRNGTGDGLDPFRARNERRRRGITPKDVSSGRFCFPLTVEGLFLRITGLRFAELSHDSYVAKSSKPFPSPFEKLFESSWIH